MRKLVSLETILELVLPAIDIIGYAEGTVPQLAHLMCLGREITSPRVCLSPNISTQCALRRGNLPYRFRYEHFLFLESSVAGEDSTLRR